VAHGGSPAFGVSIAASQDDAETWSDLPTPPQIAEGSDGGIPFLAYDDAHGLLYASMFSGGVARMRVAARP